jgi:molecular chaperone GrpE
MKERKAKTKRMKEDPAAGAESSPGEDDSIEIVEVVGLDEGRSAPAEGASQPAISEPPDSIPFTRQQLYDMLLRKQAEFENARKRTEREREEAERKIWMSLLQKLLPVMDNFHRALAGSISEAPAALHQGVALTLQQMMEILSREGLEELRSVGERFDPHLHEAVETRVVAGFEPGIVLEELRKGYRFRGHLLRPALVRVSAKAEGESVEEA